MTASAETISTTIQLILHVVLITVAVQAYRAHRTPGLCLLLFACIAYTLVRFAWFTYDLVIALLSLHLSQSNTDPLADWKVWSARLLHVVFPVLMIFALKALRRERTGVAT